MSMRMFLIFIYFHFPKSDCKGFGTVGTAGLQDHAGINDKAVLITGGNGANQSAEIYHPDRNSACVLPNIPDHRVFHTQDGSLMCGGDTTPRSCRRWNPDTGAWDLVTESLTEERWGHTSWTPADGSGTYLMGGFESFITSELIDKDNGVTTSFYMIRSRVKEKFHVNMDFTERGACSIPDPDTDTVVITGGDFDTTVSRYGKKGWIEDFSSGLKTGRNGHGCSSFIKDNERVLLVTGGTSYDILASTELYHPSAGEWREVPGGALPRPMWGVLVVTLNNRVLLFGGMDKGYNGYADILEFLAVEGRWTRVGDLSQGRALGHGVAVVDFDQFKPHCRHTPSRKLDIKKNVAVINEPAVLITGGGGKARQSAEIYHPERNSACVLPDIPDKRYGHTQDGSLLCGGLDTLRSCRRWNPDTGAWDLVTESLTEDRRCHISWTPADGSGTYLMGGWSDKTSEVIDKDNGVTSSFPLQRNTEFACSIPDPDTDTVVVTGGYYTTTTVSRYGKDGWIEDLNLGLNIGRKEHGCSSFIKDYERVLLVTGGFNSSHEPIASTEVYSPSTGEWREVSGAALPRPMWGVRVVTLNNRVLLFGGMDKGYNGYADILEFLAVEGRWTRVGDLSQARVGHGVAVVDFDQFKPHCRHTPSRKLDSKKNVAVINEPAVLITGGSNTRQSVEIYHPDRDSACVLSDIPGGRYGHTQDGSLLCEGYRTEGSCQRWNPDTGAWDLVTESLTEKRYFHTLTPADGSRTYLIGGWSSKFSEVIDKDKGVTSSFSLQHRTDRACSIPDPDTDTVVVTGGVYTPTTVSRYGKDGWIEDLSSGLKTGRGSHGCTSFLSKDNERVLLVTGGQDPVSPYEPLASTEVYRPSAGEWREVPGGALPRPMKEMRVVTLNNRVLLFGGKYMTRNFDEKLCADIMEYSEMEGRWTRVGQMTRARALHGAAVVDFDQFKTHCRP